MQFLKRYFNDPGSFARQAQGILLLSLKLVRSRNLRYNRIEFKNSVLNKAWQMAPGVCGMYVHEHKHVLRPLENLNVGSCPEVLYIEHRKKMQLVQLPAFGTPRIHDVLKDSYNQYNIILSVPFHNYRPNSQKLPNRLQCSNIERTRLSGELVRDTLSWRLAYCTMGRSMPIITEGLLKGMSKAKGQKLYTIKKSYPLVLILGHFLP